MNLQGDVVALTDTSGAAVVSYTYDAWGNVTGTSGRLAGTLGSLNPMRYRSYYFDTETGYYYLQSRYYDARWGRFINADEPELLPTIQVIDSSMNLFVYCNNNPTLNADPTGALVIPRGLVIFAIDAILWMIPAAKGAIAIATQPVKAIFRKVGKQVLSKKVRGVVGKVVTALRKHVPKLTKVLVKVLGKFTKGKGVTKWVSQKLSGVIATIAGHTFINAIVNNITCFFSIGGIIGIALDYFTDKKVDKKIRIF